MFTGSDMDTEKYSNTLIGWAALTPAPGLVPGVRLDAPGIKYNTGAQAAHDELTAVAPAVPHWVINDGGAVP